MSANIPVNYILVVKPREGLNILDRPSDTAHRYRAEMQGTSLPAYDVIDMEGVPYGWLVPGDSSHKTEWCRVGERNDREKYAKIVPIGSTPGSADSGIATAINNVALAFNNIASAIIQAFKK